MDLILRTDLGDFDLYGSEPIVQTLGVFSFEDISSRTGEYTNVFSLPLTNNNRRLIEYADFLPAINTAPYKILPLRIILNGLEFKNGLIAIEEINEDIKARFYSGNSNFYNQLKQIKLGQLDWTEYDHTWNLTNAVASANLNSGYIYPLIDYNGQNLASDILDIRKVLPATYVKTIIQKILSFTGYSFVADFNTSDYDLAVLPFSKKNPQYTAAQLLLNSLVGTNTATQTFLEQQNYIYDINNSGVQFFNFELSGNVGVNTITAGTGTYYDSSNKVYEVVITGMYDLSMFVDFVDYGVPSSAFSTYSFNSYTPDFIIPPFVTDINSFIQIIKSTQSVDVIVYDSNITTGTTVNASIFCEQGDIIQFKYGQRGTISCTVDTSILSLYDNFTFNLFPTIKNTATLDVNLQAEIVFGGTIHYNLMLPDITASNFIKDICIRFGIILNINEETKVITASNFQKIYDNIPNAVDWSDKVDDKQNPSISFSYKSNAQNNYFKHEFDKSVAVVPLGTDYNLKISNKNLDLEKTLYQSPFAASIQIDFNSTSTLGIDNYNTTTSKFSNDVKPRIAFVGNVSNIFKFTDGTTTSAYISSKRLYFIDDNVTDRAMGFESLLVKNSKILIYTLSEIKIVKNDFNLNTNDISNFNYLVPVKVDKFQSYFFVTTINQFDYSNHKLTEVELIKLNT
jgi:hypothetical protein